MKMISQLQMIKNQEYIKLLVLPPLHRVHVKLHLWGLHLVKGVVTGSGRSLWALRDNWLPRVTLP